MNAKIKNKVTVIYFLVIALFSCKQYREQTGKKNEQIISIKKFEQKVNKQPLYLEINLKLPGEAIIPLDSLDWNKIDLDSSMRIDLFYGDSLHYLIKTNLIAARIPLIFRLKKENKNLAFLMIQQFNTVHSDSLIFTKSGNEYSLKDAFHIEYTHQGKDVIQPLIVHQNKAEINLTN